MAFDFDRDLEDTIRSHLAAIKEEIERRSDLTEVKVNRLDEIGKELQRLDEEIGEAQRVIDEAISAKEELIREQRVLRGEYSAMDDFIRRSGYVPPEGC